MSIEEAGALGTYIPEEARIRGIKTNYDISAKTGRMSYLKMVEGRSKEFKTHSVSFTW
jgi:hypothetical protein